MILLCIQKKSVVASFIVSFIILYTVRSLLKRDLTMNDRDLLIGFERYLLTERRASHNTCNAYISDLSQFVHYITDQKSTLKNVDESLIKSFLKYLKETGLGARSMARKISCLKTFFSYAHEQQGMENLGNCLFSPRHEKRLPSYAQEKDIEQLLEASHQEKTDAGSRNRVMLYVLYSSGMRISELVNMTISGVNFLESSLTLKGKGGKERMIPMPEDIMVMVKEYLEVTHPRLTIKKGESYTTNVLFPTFYGGNLRPVTRQSFWLYLNDLVHKAGLTHTLSPHQLRHSLATHLLKRGVNLRSIQMLLGHETINTVQIYTHVETDHLRKIYDKKHSRS
jgi:integrase/recombinase XerD